MATGNHKVDIVVGVQDLASGALRNVQRQVSGMSRTIGSSGSSFGAFSRGLDGSIRKLDAMATSMYRFNMYTSNLQRNLKTIGALGGIALGGLAVNSASKAMDFSMETAKMQTRMEVGPKARKEIEDYILKELNREVMFTPTKIAEMATTLGQSGVDNTADMKAMLKTTTYFAEAVDADPTEAAEMIIAAAKGFKISMENSSLITDKLTTAVNKSLLRVEEMPHALGQLSGRANMFGQSLDSSLVALMTIRDQGMGAAQGSQNLLHGLRQASMIGNEMALQPRRKQFYKELGVDDSFFDMEKRQMKEYHEIIASLETTMINKGYINPKYKKGIKSFDDYQGFLEKQGGAAPDDFWDAKEAMPLITRVFGASGMTPFMMGLQSQYEEVDPETGEKTGKKYYGSAAAKKRYEEVQNSDGAVNYAHGIMEEEAKFQMAVLGGAWEASQIKFMDNMLPGIKGASELLTEWLMGGPKQPVHDPTRSHIIDDTPHKTKLQKFEGVYNEVYENFKKSGNHLTADIVKGIGDGLVAGIQIGSIAGPLAEQIASATGNLINADWGDSLWTLPWHVIENGVNFITDVGKANTSLSDAISKLPEDLQDPAELISKIAKGGLILLATGAIVGVVRLAIQGLSVALKGAKLAADLTKSISTWLAGGVSDVAKTGSGVTTMHANIVNVYGKTVTGGPGGTGAGDGKKTTPPVPIFASDGKTKLDPKTGQPLPNQRPSVILGPDGKPLPPSTPAKPTPDAPKQSLLRGAGSLAIKALNAVSAVSLAKFGIEKTYEKAAFPLMDGFDKKYGFEQNPDDVSTFKYTSLTEPYIELGEKISEAAIKKIESWEIGSEANKKLDEKLKEAVKTPYFADTELKAASPSPKKQYTYGIGAMDYAKDYSYRKYNKSAEKTEIKVEPIIENKFNPEFKPLFQPYFYPEFNPLFEPHFNPLFNPEFKPIIEAPKMPDLSEERKKLISMLPKEEAGIALKAAAVEGINGINGAITSGFNTANDKLQNVRVDNALNVGFSPTVNISGNIKQVFDPTVSFTQNRATFNQPSAKSSAANRGNSIAAKRYGPQLLQ